MEIMLGKKQIWVIFLFEFKMGCKVEETTHNISNTFGTGTANKHRVQWWFKKFCKGKESLEDEECRGWPSEVEMTDWEPSLKLILLQLHEKLPNNSATVILLSLGIWSKLERWKSCISGCLISWLQTKKIVILKCCRLLLYSQQWSISQPDCDVQRKVDFIWQLSKTNLVAGLRSSSEALPKAKLTLKNGHGHCFVVCWQSDPLQLSESLRNHYIWEVSQQMDGMHWTLKRPRLALVSWKGPILLHRKAACKSHSQHSKHWANWATKFCLIHLTHLTSRQSTTTSSSISTTFFRKTAFITRRMQKMLSKSLSNPEAWFWCYRNKQIYFSLAKMCWWYWFLFWLIKMCLSLVIWFKIYGQKP